jgi:hypothetical protein
MKLKFILILRFFVFYGLIPFFPSSLETKVKVLGNPNSYNVMVSLNLDSSNKSEPASFEHVVSYHLDFRVATKTLKSENMSKADLDGYIISAVIELESKTQKIYELELFRSNGSPEIYIYYDKFGKRLLKKESSGKKLKKEYIGKGVKKEFLDEFTIVNQHDFLQLY